MPKPLILVAVDSAQVRQQLRRDLEAKYGQRHGVIEAVNGRDAVETLRKLQSSHEELALVLIDHHLSDIPPPQIIEQTTALAPNAKRVLLVEYADAHAASRGLTPLRIDDYVVVPWQPADQRLYPVLNDLLADWESSVRPPFTGVKVIGSRFSPHSHQTRDFLVRNCVPFHWLDVERDQEARDALTRSGINASRLPLVRFPDGTELLQPTNAEIAARIGLQVHPRGTFYDLVIVGGGPAGLAAAVYGASEGLRTVVVERHAPGGQAGLSAMIENYLGFPSGLSGGDLARRAVAQARNFSVEIVTPQVVTGVRAQEALRTVTLSDGSELHCRAVLLATGVEWRRLDVPGIERLTGAGVYYGGTLAEAMFCRDEDVYIVGGANAAGQAALHFARYARTVTMLVRADSLARSMSRYLMEQIESTKNILVRLRTTVIEVQGHERLEALTVLDAASGAKETLPTSGLFIFIGALPHTEYVKETVIRDNYGFILTGPDLSRGDAKCLRACGWSLNREPFWLESSVPGIFVAGDVRHGSVKRVAAVVGEGATAIQFVHQYLEAPTTS